MDRTYSRRAGGRPDRNDFAHLITALGAPAGRRLCSRLGRRTPADAARRGRDRLGAPRPTLLGQVAPDLQHSIFAALAAEEAGRRLAYPAGLILLMHCSERALALSKADGRPVRVFDLVVGSVIPFLAGFALVLNW